MSTPQPSKRRSADSRPSSSLPASKRLKASTASHQLKSSGLEFLVDEEAREGRRLDARLTNGVPSKKALRVDESHATVASDSRSRKGRAAAKLPPVIDISSDDENSGDDSSSMDPEEAAELLAEEAKKMNGALRPRMEKLPHASTMKTVPVGDHVVNGVEPTAAVEEEAKGDNEDEPTFGDLLSARHPDPVDVLGTYGESRELIPSTTGQLQPTTTSGSLGTVLTQALKTNDADLLESCFRVTNVDSIHSTIQRLSSQYVGTLLQRIAERIYSRPGRAGTLTVWIQWSLVAHGGYLAGQPDVMRKLKALSGVLRERASGLQSLLHLKGKLDMLSAQLELRRKMQAASRAANADNLDDEEGVLYIEGQASDWSSDDESGGKHINGSIAGGTSGGPRAIKGKKQKSVTSQMDELSDGDEDDDIEEDDLMNGISDGEDEEEDSEEEGNDLLDLEAEETSDDDGADEEDEESDSDVSEEVDDEEDEDEDDADSESNAVQPARLNTLNRKR